MDAIGAKKIKMKKSKRGFEWGKLQFKYRSIRARLLIIFSVFIFFLIGIGASTLLMFRSVNANVEKIIDEDMVLVQSYEKMSYLMSQRVANLRGYLLTSEGRYLLNFNENVKESETYQQEITALDADSTTDNLFESLSEWEVYVQENIITVLKDKQRAQAVQNMNTYANPKAEEILAAITERSDSHSAAIQLNGEVLVANTNRGALILAIGVAVISLLAVVVALLFSRNFAKSIQIVMQRLNTIKSGLLNQEPLPVDGGGEVVALTQATNDMQTHLLSIINQMKTSAEALMTQSETLSFSASEVQSGSDLKEGKIIANQEVISVVFNSLDALAEIVEHIRQGTEDTADYSEITNVCDRIVARANETNAVASVQDADVSELELEETDWNVIASAQTSNYNAFKIKVTIEEDSMMVNARVFLVINKLEEVGEVMKTDPLIEVLESEEFGRTFQLLYITERDQEAVLKLINEQSEIEAVEVSLIGEKPKAVSEQIVSVNKEKTSTVQAHNHSQSVRVDLEKLDSFMNLVSELVIYRTQLEDISQKTQNKKLEETLTYVSRVTNQLQTLVLNIRMQPLQTVTSRFPRVVRDLSNDSGKPMELVIEGDDTELDRTIVSELSEPLIHLIRNSADHGIESPETRKALGKPEKGTIRISAYQEGNRVFITVSDDGKGLDAEAIKQSAEKKGISTAGLSTQEIQELKSCRQTSVYGFFCVIRSV